MKRFRSILLSVLIALGITCLSHPILEGRSLVRCSKAYFLYIYEGSFSAELDRIMKNHIEIRQYQRKDSDYKKYFMNNNKDDLIPEVSLFMQGREQYDQKNYQEAVVKWKELLDLPTEKRQDKSISTLYAIGYVSAVYLDDYEEAISYLKIARKLPNKNAYDFDTIYSGDMHAASLGWQAYAEYKSGEYASSIYHYLQLGDYSSLKIVCNAVVNDPYIDLKGLLSDTTIRDVFIAWIASRPVSSTWTDNQDEGQQQYFYDSSYSVGRVLEALEEIGNINLVNNADRIAWAYYNMGDMENARKWLSYADKESVIKLWLDAKLYIIDGDYSSAVEKLEEIIKIIDEDKEEIVFYNHNKEDTKKRIYAEIGILLLNSGDYTEALESFIKSEYWEDIAYVAEKVMTINELERYLSRDDDKGDVHSKLKYLLSRRLARNGEWDKAIQCISECASSWDYEKSCVSVKILMEKYYDYIKNAENIELPSRERANGYYNAAKIMRENGMEMVGTELDPDWYDSNGALYGESMLQRRFAVLDEAWVDQEIKLWGEDNKYILEQKEEIQQKRNKLETYRDSYNGSADEERRVLESLPEINKRFHYRYIAAELMWKCAELLPDNDELKAKALCMAGTFLKYRDSEAADKYYKALVKTCGETEIGKTACKLKWFPKMKEG